MSVALVPPLDDLAEFFCERGVKEVVHAQAGARRLCGVGGTDPFLGCANAVIQISLYGIRKFLRRTTTLRARPPSVRLRSGENQRQDVRDRK